MMIWGEVPKSSPPTQMPKEVDWMQDRDNIMAQIMDELEDMSVDGMNRVLGFACGINVIEQSTQAA